MNNLTPSAVSPSLFLFLPDSICPKGWELPRYSNDKSYWKLLKDVYGQMNSSFYGDKGIFLSPLSFFRAGRYNFDSSNPEGRSYYAFYWAAGVKSIAIAQRFYFSQTSLTLIDGSDNGNGFAVRCVSK